MASAMRLLQIAQRAPSISAKCFKRPLKTIEATAVSVPSLMPLRFQCFVLACALFALAAANDAPVIGILTQPYSGPNASKSVRLPLPNCSSTANASVAVHLHRSIICQVH